MTRPKRRLICTRRPLQIPRGDLTCSPGLERNNVRVGGQCPQARARRHHVTPLALQGDYVALASEPLSICGVDVSAPQQFRGQRRVSLDEMLANIGSVFTQNEVSQLFMPHDARVQHHTVS